MERIDILAFMLEDQFVMGPSLCLDPYTLRMKARLLFDFSLLTLVSTSGSLFYFLLALNEWRQYWPAAKCGPSDRGQRSLDAATVIYRLRLVLNHGPKSTQTFYVEYVSFGYC